MSYKITSSNAKARPIRAIYIFYWILLAYIVAALVFWFISLNNQNIELSRYKLEVLNVNDVARLQKQQQIIAEKGRKTTQYVGEGITFFLLIVAGRG